MKLNFFVVMVLFFSFQFLKIVASNLQELEAERELRNLVKIKLHGEPLELSSNWLSSSKTVAFSPDGKHLAVAYAPGTVLVYDITAEKVKRFDNELEKMKQEAREAEPNKET